MDTNIYIYGYIYGPRVLRLRSKGREESRTEKFGRRIPVVNRTLFATCHYVPTFGSVQFHAWRGGLEEVSVPSSARHPASPSAPTNLTTVSLWPVEYVYNNQQPRYYVIAS